MNKTIKQQELHERIKKTHTDCDCCRNWVKIAELRDRIAREEERERIVRLLVELGYKIVCPYPDKTVEEFVTKAEMLALTTPLEDPQTPAPGDEITFGGDGTLQNDFLNRLEDKK